jgi:Sulfatase-modifying factor enzyme 1
LLTRKLRRRAAIVVLSLAPVGVLASCEIVDGLGPITYADGGGQEAETSPGQDAPQSDTSHSDASTDGNGDVGDTLACMVGDLGLYPTALDSVGDSTICIDKTEITGSDYSRFSSSGAMAAFAALRDAGCAFCDPPNPWPSPDAAVNHPGDPVVDVTPCLAAVYCKMTNRELCTTAEWQMACEQGVIKVAATGDVTRTQDGGCQVAGGVANPMDPLPCDAISSCPSGGGAGNFSFRCCTRGSGGECP